MKEKHYQLAGILLTLLYGGAIGWLYWAAPKNFEDATLKAKETLENTATRSRVIVGAYEVDAARFADGVKAFRAENYVGARQYFEAADPERRDPKTQFYIAYSFYRQGFGRVYNDDELFKKGLEQTGRVIALDRNYTTDDPDLRLRTAAELKNELEEGLRLSAEDFNPLKLTRERK